MDVSWLQILRCPLDGAALQHVPQGAVCTHCQRLFPMVEGVLSFVVAELEQQHQSEEWRRKQQEMRARDAQSLRYDRLLGLRLLSPIEAHKTLLALHAKRLRFHTLIEVGCGTGRMLQRFARLADRVIGVDFSLHSLLRCQQRLQRAGVAHRALLLHADACYLPLKNASVQAVASCQLIEHIPSERLRWQALSEMARILQPEGRYVISGYCWSWATRWFSAKEGYHPGGIYFYRFSRAEFSTLIASHLQIDRLDTVLGYIWLASGRKEA